MSAADLQIRTDSELMVAGVQGLTEQGVDFVEAIADPVRVVDADRVIVRAGAVPRIERDAVVGGLRVDRDVVARLVPRSDG